MRETSTTEVTARCAGLGRISISANAGKAVTSNQPHSADLLTAKIPTVRAEKTPADALTISLNRLCSRCAKRYLVMP